MKVTKIETNQFKTNLCAIFLSLPLEEETITYNALIPAVLRRGTANLTNQLEINKMLENMYGANFNCGIDKVGDFCILKFFIEVVNDKYLPEKELITKKAINLLKDIIFNPLVENNSFNTDYVKQEKENLKKIILARKDDKTEYANNRCIEEMFKGEPYGIYKYGKIEDIEKINEKKLYEYYKKMIKNCKINLFVSGDTSTIKDLDNILTNDNQNFKSIKQSKHNAQHDKKIIKENMDIAQGKLVIGLDTLNNQPNATAIYNVVLGGGANSKLFQNVREKSSLAYYASSTFIKRKNAIIIRAGIEINNYDKTIKIIEKQLQDMKDGKITDKEIKEAKQLFVSSLKQVQESQQDLITFYFDKELFEENIKIEDYIKGIENVTKQQVIDVAQNVKIDTIYFLQKE